MSSSDWGSYDDEKEKPRLRRNKDGFLRRDDLLYEFDCPECNANNPWDDGFTDQSEVQCHYCGQDLRVTVLDGRRLKFKVL